MPIYMVALSLQLSLAHSFSSVLLLGISRFRSLLLLRAPRVRHSYVQSLGQIRRRVLLIIPPANSEGEWLRGQNGNIHLVQSSQPLVWKTDY